MFFTGYVNKTRLRLELPCRRLASSLALLHSCLRPTLGKDNRYAEGRLANLNWHTVNTCATRLSDAITRVDPNFFHGVAAGPKWHEPIKTGGRYLPMNAGALAGALRHKLGSPILVGSSGKL
jgi:hypothetical protein